MELSLNNFQFLPKFQCAGQVGSGERFVRMSGLSSLTRPPATRTPGGLSPTTPATWSGGPPTPSPSSPAWWCQDSEFSGLGLIQRTHFRLQSYLPKLSARTKIGSINYNIFRYVWIFLFVTSAVIIREQSQAGGQPCEGCRLARLVLEFVVFLLLSLWW